MPRLLIGSNRIGWLWCEILLPKEFGEKVGIYSVLSSGLGNFIVGLDSWEVGWRHEDFIPGCFL